MIFWAILVLFWAIMGPPWASEKGPGWFNMTYNHVIYPLEVFWGHLGSCRAIWGHEGPFHVLFWAIMGPPWASEKGPGWSNMTYDRVIYPWEVF